MTKINLVASFAAAVVGTLAVAASAQAATVTYSGYTITGQNVTVTSPLSISANAGQIKLDVVGGPDILAWCVDIYDFLKSSGTYTVGALVNDGAKPTPNLLSSSTIGKIGALVHHGDDLIAAAATLAEKRNIGAAIQLAIWKTEYSGLSYTASGAVTGLVNTYLGNVASGAWAENHAIRALTETGNQTLVTGVPEPSTWAMMLVGFLGLAMATSRRRKENALAA